MDTNGDPTDETISVNALPFRAYVLILNEWYRQQSLQDPLVFSTDSGDDTTTDLTLYNRNWNKDYFTACLPTTQKGPTVVLPLAGTAPVVGRAPVTGIANFSAPETSTSLAFPRDYVNSSPIDVVETGGFNTSYVAAVQTGYSGNSTSGVRS